MSIRYRIFRSYIILIIIVLIYIGLSFSVSSFRLQMEKEKNCLLEVNILWGDILVFMNETMSNWNEGETYGSFLSSTNRFNKSLVSLMDSPGKSSFYGKGINQYINNLDSIWELAQVNIKRIEEIRAEKSFLEIEELLVLKPGLQRMYPLYMELISDREHQRHVYAYALKEYIDAVEFFPIYSDTMNYLFSEILEMMEIEYKRLQLIQNFLSILFFVIFLFSIVMISGHFTNSLSLPIMNLSNKLKGFMGKSVEPSMDPSGDELMTLETSVDDLIDHYTHLSKLAHRLSTGHLETSLLDLPRQGVVGNALKEVASYLKELADAADRIRNGEYGLEVSIKSEHDVLGRSFNFMSREIAEKFSTLTNMFEAIDEGLLLTDNKGLVIETNHRFLDLLGAKDRTSLELSDPLMRVAGNDSCLRDKLISGELISDLNSEIINYRGDKIPVKLNVRPLLNAGKERAGVMLLVSNESVRVRMHREKEKLEAQAMEAELRALRAQINPHFLFNTLNTIAHFIETDSSTAVGVLERLAELFRYSLLSTKRKTVALSEELLHIKGLLEIECIRHGSRLNINYKIDNNTRDVEIPPMLLQPIIENAISYGGDSEGNIAINIVSRLVGDYLLVEISDHGVKDIEIEGLLSTSRTGLKNVNQRLLTLYRRSLEFEINNPRGLVVRVRIPAKEGSYG
ncbi:MAG: hypothetical protein B6241_11835 [Spirochaetaceae bacterium 4572_59]|nr:MAG: hypothetical protein B6241_11835 [Spirochaetaceae bacterium 4572_59]